MAQRYTFPQPGVSSISVDGIEHKIDAETGELVVEVLTPNLLRELGSRGCVLIDESQRGKPGTPPGNPIAPNYTPAEKAEREALFLELDAVMNTSLDRRRSLKQLREMKANLPTPAETKSAASSATTEPGGAA